MTPRGRTSRECCRHGSGPLHQKHFCCETSKPCFPSKHFYAVGNHDCGDDYRLLAVIAICDYIIARDTSRLTVIRSNLQKIDHAKEQLAVENHKEYGTPVEDVTVLNDYLHEGTIKVVVQETSWPNPVGTPRIAVLATDVKLGPYGYAAVIAAHHSRSLQQNSSPQICSQTDGDSRKLCPRIPKSYQTRQEDSQRP